MHRDFLEAYRKQMEFTNSINVALLKRQRVTLLFILIVFTALLGFLWLGQHQTVRIEMPSPNPPIEQPMGDRMDRAV